MATWKEKTTFQKSIEPEAYVDLNCRRGLPDALWGCRKSKQGNQEENNEEHC